MKKGAKEKTKEEAKGVVGSNFSLLQIIVLRDGLRKIKGYKSREFAYKVEQNIVAITDALRAVLPQDEGVHKILAPYKEELVKLVEKHKRLIAKESDEEQKKRLEQDYEAQFAMLEDKHQKIRDEFKSEYAKLQEMYKVTDSSYVPIKFKLDLVPKDILNDHLQFLFPLILE